MPCTVTIEVVRTDGLWSITVYGEDNYLMIAQAVKISERRKHTLDLE